MSISATFLVLTLMTETAPAAAPVPPVNPLDKVVCRQITEVGSLVKGKKICMTRRQWNLASEESRERGEEMKARITTQPGG